MQTYDSWDREVLTIGFYKDCSYAYHRETSYKDVSYTFESFSTLENLEFDLSDLDYLIDYGINEMELTQTYNFY